MNVGTQYQYRVDKSVKYYSLEQWTNKRENDEDNKPRCKIVRLYPMHLINQEFGGVDLRCENMSNRTFENCIFH